MADERLVERSTFVAQTCCVCGVVFALNRMHEQGLRESKQTFYCPNGHSLTFLAKTLGERLTEEQARNDRLSKRLDLAERLEAEAQATVRRQVRSLAATRGQVTKLRKRIASGTCPYCTRHFEALERHISCKHRRHAASGRISRWRREP